MRNAVVGRELDAFGIDHDEPHLGWSGSHEHRHDHGIDADGFTGAGCTADEQVRHFCEVADNRVALDILSDRHLKRTAMHIFQDVAEQNVLSFGVRHFDADEMRSGNRGENTHTGSSQSKRNVIVERNEPAHTNARRKVDFEQRDRRTSDPINHCRHDSEIFHGLLKARRCFLKLTLGGFSATLRFAYAKQFHLRQLETFVWHSCQRGFFGALQRIDFLDVFVFLSFVALAELARKRLSLSSLRIFRREPSRVSRAGRALVLA